MTIKLLIDKAWQENYDWIEGTYTSKETHGQSQLELLRLAVCDRNEDAWEAIYQIYKVQTYVWAMRINNGYTDGTEALALRGFTRFWKTMTPERLQGFTNIRAIMGYIHQCIRSEAIDDARKPEPFTRCIDPRKDAGVYDGYLDEVDEERAQFWQIIAKHTESESEWLAVRLYFLEGCKHKEMSRRYPEHFAKPYDAFNEIRRVTQRLSRREDVVQLRESWRT